MDWVQVYSIVITTAAVVGPMCLAGSGKDDYEWYEGIVHSLIYGPLFGRVFGWW